MFLGLVVWGFFYMKTNRKSEKVKKKNLREGIRELKAMQIKRKLVSVQAVAVFHTQPFS